MDLQIRASDPQLEAQHLSVHHAKESCFRRMDDCLAQQNLEFTAKAQTVEQMLQLWAKHSGVDARQGMSLDDRLKDHLDLKATLIGLLELIEQKMAQALSSTDDHGDAETAPAMVSRDNDDIDPEEFLIKQKWRSYKGNVWEAVGAAVDMLIELTAMIRKSTVRNASFPTHFHPPDDYFADYAKTLARNWFKDARRSLTDQLGDSVFVRRSRMLYKMKHEEKISYPSTQLAPIPVEPAPTPLQSREATPKMESPKETTARIKALRPVVPIFANPSPSSTNVSQVDRTRLKQHRGKIGALSGITEGSVSIEETEFSYMYPEPPALGENQRYGVCPYCSVFLSASELTTKSWRKHLHEDLKPYVCISEKCRDPAQFFSNSAQWLQHMDKLHGKDWPQKAHMATWYCDREHNRLEFKSESELRKHLIDNHGSLRDAHVSALVRRNWGVGRREAHVCPLCESTPSNIVPLMNDKDKEFLLHQHIGNHLKALALFSLPSLRTDPASDEQSFGSGAQLLSNDDTKPDPSGNDQAVSQAGEDLKDGLTFDDDPHSLMDVMNSEAKVNKKDIPDASSDLDAALEWGFVIPEQEGPELDPVLETLRIGQGQSQKVPVSPHKGATLSEQIIATSVESVFDHPPRRFYPNGSVDRLITKESVTSELKVKPSFATWRQGDFEDLIEFILVSAKKLFAITLLTQPRNLLIQRMVFFRHKDITDLNLPLQESWLKAYHWRDTGRVIHGHTQTVNDSCSDSPENEGLWSSPRIKHFCLVQHMFLAPVFSNAGLSYDLDSDTIIPFTEKCPENNEYGFESNTKVRIHEQHVHQQAMDAGRPYYVYVRKFRLSYGESITAWPSHITMLSHMHSLNHHHIVRFLAAFERDQEECFTMFEWASGGNLRDLWRNFHRPVLTSGLVKGAFRLMVELTSAMSFIHDGSLSLPSFKSHLTPKNILWFKSDNDNEFGTLKIDCPVSQERIHELDLKYGMNKTSRYTAPEWNRIQSPLGGIWSLGCIMLEFAIWLMYGVDGLNRFSQASQERKFFDDAIDEDQYGGLVVTAVDPVVLKWMDHMAADPACEAGSTALGNLLELIRTRLLVGKLPQGSGPAPDTVFLPIPTEPHSSIADERRRTWERCTAHKLQERMQKISGKNKTERYWLAAQPKCPPGVEDR